MSDSPLQLSKLIYGTMGYGRIAPEQRIRCIHAAIDHGLTSIDTAPLYGFGEVECIVGQAIRDRRNQVQILGKCGLRWDAEYGEATFAAQIHGQMRMIRKDSRPQALQRDVEASLNRLQVETIDLMQVHEHDRLTPLDDTLDCLQRLQTQGKIRAIGVSNFPGSVVASVLSTHPGTLASFQNMFNLLDQDSSAEVRTLAQRNHLLFLGYSPFSQGALAGKLLNNPLNIRDWRSGSASFHPQNVARINAVLSRVALPMTQKYDITLPQLVLEATLARDGITNVIVGAGSPEQVGENARALSNRVPQDALDELAQAIRNCGWSSLAGEPWLTRVRALARRMRHAYRLRRR